MLPFSLSKQHAMTLLLGLLAIFTAWLIWDLNQPIGLHTIRHTPDAFAENVRGTRIDESGQIADQFYSPSLWHYEDDQSIEFINPKLVVYSNKPGSTAWQITANHGNTNRDLSVINLWGNILCYQPAGPANPETRLTTSAVTLYPKQKFAHTDQFVQADQPGIQITAVGATVDLNTNQTHLISQVKGHYVPHK